MKIVSLLIAVTTSLLLFPDGQVAHAQSEDSKLELGAQFSSIRLSNRPGTRFFDRRDRWSSGFGARFSYNTSHNIALETEVNHFPNQDEILLKGSKTQALFGLKAGIRKQNFGLFGKVRPGFIHFSEDFEFPGSDPQGNFEFAVDIGGVFEVYPTRRVVIRFDAGDTIIRFEEKRGVQLFQSAGTSHNFQFNVGVGIRF